MKLVTWKFALSASSHITYLACKLMLNIFCLFLQMVELTAGSQVFIYQNLIQQAIAKTSYKAAASFLLNCFYTNDELMGMNLSGANGKPHPDKHILDAIIGTVC